MKNFSERLFSCMNDFKSFAKGIHTSLPVWSRDEFADILARRIIKDKLDLTNPDKYGPSGSFYTPDSEDLESSNYFGDLVIKSEKDNYRAWERFRSSTPKIPSEPYSPYKPNPPSKTKKVPVYSEKDQKRIDAMNERRSKPGYHGKGWVNATPIDYREEPNENYDREMKWYQESLDNYNKKLEQYEKDKSEYPKKKEEAIEDIKNFLLLIKQKVDELRSKGGFKEAFQDDHKKGDRFGYNEDELQKNYGYTVNYGLKKLSEIPTVKYLMEDPLNVIKIFFYRSDWSSGGFSNSFFMNAFERIPSVLDSLNNYKNDNTFDHNLVELFDDLLYDRYSRFEKHQPERIKNEWSKCPYSAVSKAIDYAIQLFKYLKGKKMTQMVQVAAKLMEVSTYGHYMGDDFGSTYPKVLKELRKQHINIVDNNFHFTDRRENVEHSESGPSYPYYAISRTTYNKSIYYVDDKTQEEILMTSFQTGSAYGYTND